MCGIAGIVRFGSDERTLSESTVPRMLERIAHRGPDEKGIYADDRCVFGHVRLSIVGGQSGRQPICKGGHVLVFNGEIYNFKDFDKAARSDTQVLFHLLAKGGVTDCVLNSLNGVWAFCFSDEKYVYLVRDRFGEKPMYYTTFRNHLYFCSEIKGMLAIPGLDLEIDLPELYSQLETTISGRTIFKQIFEVLPGSYVAFEKRSGIMRQRRYYSLYNVAAQDRQSFNVEQCSSLIVDAITLRAPCTSYGVYISGGIDSSAVAQILTPDQVLTCTAQIPDISEEKYADMIAACRSGAVDYTKVGGSNSTSDFIEVVYANDGPTTTFAAISEFLMAQKVRHKVVLSGMGVDEFFGGYGRHMIACQDVLPKEITNQYRYLMSKVGSLSLSPAQKYYRLVNRGSPHSSLERLVEDAFSVAMEPISAMGVCDSVTSLVPLLSTSDKMNMWSGVEVRNPFLDHRVVEYGLSLRMHDKIRHTKKGIVTKYAFREAVKDFLPREIYERKDKIGFSSEINRKLRGEWSHLTEKFADLLKQEYPKEGYYRSPLPLEMFDRKRYQIFQIGITHLLFCRKLTIPDIVEFMGSTKF